MLSLAGRRADTVGINARMSSVVPTGRSVEDLTRDSVGEKRRWAREAAASVGRDPDALDFQFSVLSLRLDDVPEARDWTCSLAREADPALDSPSLVHGPVGACAEQLYADREALGLNHVHLGGDPVAAAALMAAVG